MDNSMSKKLAMLLNKIPKKDLEKNLEKAKEILANSNKEDLQAFLNSKPISDLLGKDKDRVAESINKNEINLDNVKRLNSNEIK